MGGRIRSSGTRQATGRGSGRALVPVMEAADLGDRDDATPGRRLDVSGNGSVPLEREMRARPIVVADVALEKAAEVSLA